MTQARYRVAHLNPNQPTPFELTPDKAARDAIATELTLLSLPALTFRGKIVAAPSDAWQVDGTLEARVVQACVVTLAPVETAIKEQVDLTFSPHTTTPQGDEVEMGDDQLEPLGQFIDIEAVMIEALSLGLPLYPRAPGAELPDTTEEPASDTRKPFAGLADLINLKDRKN